MQKEFWESVKEQKKYGIRKHHVTGQLWPICVLSNETER